MNAHPATVDRHGNAVQLGDRVRILAVSPDPDMDEDDLDMFNDMIGSTCEVERIDDEGAAWVAIWWNGFDGPLLTTVGLAPGQMEKAAA
ncbi:MULTISPECIES: hypothetical protein [Dechloromonas]|uniref:DUF4926 domain-containing protein n=1 Tax=Dechloromonas denitrificans TaxID=281362 RepID=A0A133XJ98_9RHOO|nr:MULTISPECIES: hypothetical protein [Dechloromonas]KXB31024.1 hypothetical protein AT959_10000 [Dechloromonas denitrificans]